LQLFGRFSACERAMLSFFHVLERLVSWRSGGGGGVGREQAAACTAPGPHPKAPFPVILCLFANTLKKTERDPRPRKIVKLCITTTAYLLSILHLWFRLFSWLYPSHYTITELKMAAVTEWGERTLVPYGGSFLQLLYTH
jgi:hypothetical protein